MAKDKKRNYEDKSKSEVLTEESRNALLGILLFLVAVIGLVETAGPIGKIIRYIFVFLLGTYSSLILAALAMIGGYVFFKRKFPKFKINLTMGAILLLILFALIYSSKNDWTLANLMTNYRDIFDSISKEGYITVFSSSIAGGFIGHFMYALLNSFVGHLGAQIICVVFILGSLLIILQPVIYFVGNKLMVASSKVVQENKKKIKDREIKPNIIFDNDNEEIIETSKSSKYQIQEEPVINIEKEETPQISNDLPEFKKKKANAFDIFNNEYDFGKMNRHIEKEDKPRPYDIFNDKLFDKEQEILNNQRIKINNIYEEENISNDIEPHSNVIVEDREIKETILNTSNNSIFNNLNNIEEDLKVTPLDAYEEEEKEEVTEIIEEQKIEEEKEVEKTSNPFMFPFDKKEEVNVNPFFADNQTKEEEKEEVKPEVKEEKKKIERPFKNFVLPSLALLDEPVNYQEAENRANAERKGVLLNKKLQDLGIKARVVNYRISASFTRYEISLDTNAKINQFNNLGQDFMMALSAEKVNILAPIPGSEFIGVEIPNPVRSPVSLKESLAGTISYSTPPLMTAIGKDAIGEIISFDLAKTPHLLVAGSTGSGKSVCMNAILMSLLMHNSPNDLRIIIIDPKRVEFTAYSDIPHLACPVITDIGKAGMALTRLVDFMNDRYKILEHVGAKNIEVYNRMMEKQGKDKMEYYVCIVDELADLFMNVKSAENSIKEITQLSRAVGIHMIVATQRPSVDVITGTIKNNIPSRIAFAVTTGADSRTILDSVGAENLLGRGDMLVNIAGRLSMTRGQGCNVTDDEIERVVDFIKRQGKPIFNPRFMDLEPPKPEAQEIQTSGTPEDDLMNEVIAYMSMGNHVSTTKIQTKFNIGYPRAARIIERLAEANMIYRDPQTKQWVLNENTLDTD